jgi:large subunit ribosomal protein L3
MVNFIKLLAEKQKMISYTKNNGEIVAATILQLYPHYFFDESKEDYNGNINLYLCSKSLSLRKQKLTKSTYQLFEKRHLLPMQKIMRSSVNNKILELLVKDNILHKKFNLIKFLRLDKLKCEYVDIITNSKGRGFTGTIKRFNFKQGPKTHGSKSYRRPGSIGAGTSPGRVLKNKRMAGHCGNEKITIKNLKVLSKSNYTLTIKGSIPGRIGGDVFVIIKY